MATCPKYPLSIDRLCVYLSSIQKKGSILHFHGELEENWRDDMKSAEVSSFFIPHLHIYRDPKMTAVTLSHIPA